MSQQHTHAAGVYSWARSSSHHLQNISNRVINVPILTPIKLLCIHDDHQVRQTLQTPDQRLRTNEHLNGSSIKQARNPLPLLRCKSFVDETHPVLKSLLQGLLASPQNIGSHVILVSVQKALGLVIGGGLQKQVNSSDPSLLAVGHKHNHRLVRGVVLDGLVHRSAHSQQPCTTMVQIETLDDHLEWHSADVRRKVEEPCVFGANPLCHVFRVCERRRQCHDSNFPLNLVRNVPHPGNNSLDSWPDFAVQKMQLVDNEEPDVLDCLSRLPSPRQKVPPVRDCNDDVGFLQDLVVRCRLPSQARDLESEFLTKFLRPVFESLVRCLLIWCNIDATLDRVVFQHVEQCKLGTNNFPGSRRRTQHHVVGARVHCRKDLGCDGIEYFLPGEQLFSLRVPKCRHRQGLQI
mmetsp:Transcript_37640/g.90407  ORF Transcript_37640/g.90407 Transcript_37640/m.90407 type:complete len:405 (+) Transcript_37640:1331-2545(+)